MDTHNAENESAKISETNSCKDQPLPEEYSTYCEKFVNILIDLYSMWKRFLCLQGGSPETNMEVQITDQLNQPISHGV